MKKEKKCLEAQYNFSKLVLYYKTVTHGEYQTSASTWQCGKWLWNLNFGAVGIFPMACLVFNPWVPLLVYMVKGTCLPFKALNEN